MSPRRNDEKAEQEETYYANGRIKHRGSQLDGQMHRLWQFYRLDGSLMREGSFDRGRQIGSWRTYDRKGNIVKETRFGTTE